ncbi:hypothetical protein [Mesorhizobium sophorae]|uniref:hypothetical protein n=1 Tax=Mesorhizobium sophorae TaxID=1300294 RepID=UPI000BA3943E|nr:hypothetical protein [Mesorhizobium sophorae]
MNLMSKIISPTEADRHRAALRLPRPSREYVCAEKSLRDATANLHRLTNRREALKIEASVHNPVKARLPTYALEAALDGLTVEIADAQNVERTARAEFQTQRNTYQQDASAALQADIENFGAAITQRLDEILELLDIGTELATQAREMGLSLPSAISDAPVGRRLAETMSSTISRMFSTRGARR